MYLSSRVEEEYSVSVLEHMFPKTNLEFQPEVRIRISYN